MGRSWGCAPWEAAQVCRAGVAGPLEAPQAMNARAPAGLADTQLRAWCVFLCGQQLAVTHVWASLATLFLRLC